MSKQVWIIIALVGGMVLPIQAAVNARMREFVINPFYSTLINFATGLVAIGAVCALSLGAGHPGALRSAVAAPWWAWIGGVLGVALVTISYLAIPYIGSAVLAAAVVGGQLLAAVLIDHFGILGVPQHPISVSRVAGIGALLLGLYLVRR